MPVLRRFAEQRSIENPAVPLTATNLAALLDGTPTYSGTTVNERTAMRLIAVYRCVELIAGTCAALPLKAYKKGTRTSVDAPVLYDPHPELTKFEVWEIAYTSLLLWGNAYFRKLRDGTGRIRYLWPIEPSRVHVDLIDPTESNPGGKVFAITDKNGQRQPYTGYEILHIPGLGYDGRVGLSRIQLGKQSLGVGMAAEEYAARFFGSGSMMSGILTSDANIDQVAADALKARWREKVGGLNKAHEIAVMGGGAKFQPISIPPGDAQLLETRDHTTEDIAMMFGLPPHAISHVSKSTSWGSGIEQQTIGMVQFTLQPSYLTRVEQRLTKEVLLNPSVYAEHTVEGLLRGDSKARAAFYQTMVTIRAMNPNEVRSRENLEPYDGGDEFISPNIDPAVPADDGADAEENSARMALEAERRHSELLAAATRNQPITVNTPDVHVDIKPPDVHIDAPVTVNTPDVRVDVAQPEFTLDAPVVNVHLPEARSVTKRITRDAAGNIATIEEE